MSWKFLISLLNDAEKCFSDRKKWWQLGNNDPVINFVGRVLWIEISICGQEYTSDVPSTWCRKNAYFVFVNNQLQLDSVKSHCNIQRLVVDVKRTAIVLSLWRHTRQSDRRPSREIQECDHFRTIVGYHEAPYNAQSGCKGITGDKTGLQFVPDGRHPSNQEDLIWTLKLHAGWLPRFALTIEVIPRFASAPLIIPQGKWSIFKAACLDIESSEA